MSQRTVVFSRRAAGDLRSIIAYIAQDAPRSAVRQAVQVRDFCVGLSRFPEHGTARDDVAPGVRTIPFRGFLTIAIRIEARRVTVVAIFYRGRDLDTALREAVTQAGRG